MLQKQMNIKKYLKHPEVHNHPKNQQERYKVIKTLVIAS